MSSASALVKTAKLAKLETVDLSKLDKLPPHSEEAERGVIGCLLLMEPKLLAEWFGSPKMVRPDDFYHLPNRLVFNRIAEMVQSGMHVDLLTFQQYLRDKGELDSIGGLPFLSSLIDEVPSAHNIGSYLESVTQKASLRRIVNTSTEIMVNAQAWSESAESMHDLAEAAIMSARREVAARQEKSMVDHCRGAIDLLEARCSGKLVGVPTGIDGIDKLTGGLRGGRMIVIAARPSVGKTALAMNIADHVATSGVPVGVFSLEMMADELVERMICAKGRINSFKASNWTDQQRRLFAASAGRVCKLPIYIDDTETLTINAIRARARRWKIRFNIGLLVVDYLQLVASDSKSKSGDRREEVDNISRGLKSLAKELGIPVIVLAQLNRDVDKERSRKPRLSDLRESGQIEQDGDIIGLLYKQNPDHDPDDMVIETNLLIAKQRGGPTGEVPLTFFKEHTLFQSRSPIQD